MRDLAVLFLHLLATVARLAGPGGARSVVAESVLVKQQLLIRNRSRTPFGTHRHRRDAADRDRACTRFGLFLGVSEGMCQWSGLRGSNPFDACF